MTGISRSSILFFEKVAEAEEIENALQQLPCQKSPEIAGDANCGNRQKDEEQADQQADYIHDKDASCPAQSLKNAGQCGVQIEKGTDEAQSGDEMTGEFAVEEQPAQKVSQQPKTAHTGTAQQTTVFYGADDCFLYGCPVSEGIIFRDNGQQQDCHGTGQGIGKED